MDEKRRTVFSKLVEIGIPAEKALDAVIGASEVGLSIITGLGATVAGLPGSAIETIRGRGTAEQKEKYPGLKLSEEKTPLPTVGKLAEDWAYQPKTETGQDYLENVGDVMEHVDEWLRIGSGAIPQTLGKVIPGDSRVEAGLMNAADQAIYTALNVMSPTKGVSGAAMIGAKGAQGAMKALGAKNADLVNPMAKAIEKTPGLSRYSQFENAMGQLISRKQLAGLPENVVQDTGLISALPKGVRGTINKAQGMPDLPTGYKKGAGGWYAGGFNKARHLGAMLNASVWNKGRKMTNNQDAWLRAHYGITANVFQELQRLGQVIDDTYVQASNKSWKSPYLDTNGNKIKVGDKNQSVDSVRKMAENQYHAQLAYNRSVLEKYKPGDPRIERLISGELDKYLTPKHVIMTRNQFNTKAPQAIQEIIGGQIDEGILKRHVGNQMIEDMNLKSDNIHLSTKPFFFLSAKNALVRTASSVDETTGIAGPYKGGATGIPGGFLKSIVRDGKLKAKISKKTHGDYTGQLQKFLRARAGMPTTKKDVLDHFKVENKRMDIAMKDKIEIADRDLRAREAKMDPSIRYSPARWTKAHKKAFDKTKSLRDRKNQAQYDLAYVRKNLVDDGEYMSITQQALTDDTLLATIPIRMIVNKNNPELGYYVLYDQMKQGSGIPIIEAALDAGSDMDRIYIDIQPLKAGVGAGERVSMQTDVATKPEIPGRREAGKGTVEERLVHSLREQKFDDPMSPEFLKKRRLDRRLMPLAGWGGKRGATVGLLSQDENEQTRNFY